MDDIVARSIVAGTVPVGSAEPMSDPVQSRVAALIRMPPLVCQGSEPIREAARRMTEQGASAVLVPLGGPFGIVTDRDLRTRVIAAGLSPDGPVSAIMTAPAYTVTADRLGGDVLLDMLERNVHHIPVLSAAGEVLGVVDDGDLVAAESRKPLLLRRAIALAESQADLAAAAAGLGPVIIALHDARVAAEHVAAVRSVVLEALILVSLIADSRPVFSTGPSAGEGLWPGQASPEHPQLLRLLARFALSFRPPTGFLRNFVVEHSGERRGQLDIKHGGLIPIVDLARWAGMAAGVASASTMERLRAAEAAQTLDASEARTLMEAFGFIFSLRLDHQVEQLRRGEAPDDFIDPRTLNPLARSYLREAFRAVASVQAGLSAELSHGVRWG